MYVRWDGPQRCWILRTLTPPPSPPQLSRSWSRLMGSRELRVHNGTTSPPTSLVSGVLGRSGRAGPGVGSQGRRSVAWDAG